MKIRILPVAFVVLVLSENMLLGAPTNRSGTLNTSSAKLVTTSTAKAGKIVSLTTTPTKRSSSTTKNYAKGLTGKTITLKTTTQKFANLKDTQRTTKSSRTSMKPATIKTPFGTMEKPFHVKPYPTSKTSSSLYQPAQPFDVPGVMFSAPFFPGHVSEDYENPFGEPLDSANITATAVKVANITEDKFANVTTTEVYGNVTSFEHGDFTRAEYSLPLEEDTFYGVTVEPDMNFTLTATTKKRLKRKKTTVSAESTTRKQLKRKRTTTVAPSEA